jgi:hypothetical protein
MMRHDLPADKWVKSSYSGPQQGDCLEYQLVEAGGVAVGDSKDRSQGAFVFTACAWQSFLEAVKAGEFPQ